MFIALLSAKGTGVTTTAAALAAVAPDPRLLVELDPAGGDLELMTGLHDRPPLARAVASLDNGIERLPEFIREAPPGIPAILAPASGTEAEETLARAGGRVGVALAHRSGGLVIGDLGRWNSQQRSATRVFGAALVVVVCLSTAQSVAHAAAIVTELYAVPDLRDRRVPVALLVVGDRHYPVDDIRRALVGVPVLGPLPTDRSGADLLMTTGPSRRWRYSRLGRAVPGVLAEVMALCSGVAGSHPGVSHV